MTPRGADNGPLRVILVGSLTPRISGTSILLEQLAAELKDREGFELAVVDTGGIRGHGIGGILRYFGMLRRIWTEAGRADILSLHLSVTALALVAPAALATARARGAKMMIRLFGGAGYRSLRGPSRSAAKWSMKRADLCLVETRLLAEEMKRDGVGRVAWYANSRPMPDGAVFHAPAACRRFVFIGRLCAEKGVREAVEAAETLDGEASLDVYGPFWGNSLSEDLFRGRKRTRYRGPIGPEQVLDVMREHDALLLPTRHRDEGYPGGVIEAFAAGRPVICTRWMALPEMVDESCGILIEPGDDAGLFAAMKRLTDDPMLYNRLCEGAWKRRMNYSSVAWSERFVEICRRLVRGPWETS
jgi:hypothetical protein